MSPTDHKAAPAARPLSGPGRFVRLITEAVGEAFAMREDMIKRYPRTFVAE